MEFNLFRTVLFDWGNTLMHDDPAQTTAMMNWPQVHIVTGADRLLSTLHARGMKLALATGALDSGEQEIRAALARVQIDKYIENIYCYGNTGLRKPSAAFYKYILQDLNANPSETLMVGDSFEYDVTAANQSGINAVWLNTNTKLNKSGVLFCTVHNHAELLALFQPPG